MVGARVRLLLRDGGERGAALLTVVMILIVVLIGGLAAIAITNGELGSSRAFRGQAATEACANAALERVRALLPDATFDETAGSLAVGESTFAFRGSHYTGDRGSSPIVALDATNFDANALYQGENITNNMGTVTGSMAEGYRVLSTTAICAGPGFGAREMQFVFRYGVSTGGR